MGDTFLRCTKCWGSGRLTDVVTFEKRECPKCDGDGYDHSAEAYAERYCQNQEDIYRDRDCDG